MTEVIPEDIKVPVVEFGGETDSVSCDMSRETEANCFSFHCQSRCGLSFESFLDHSWLSLTLGNLTYEKRTLRPVAGDGY